MSRGHLTGMAGVYYVAAELSVLGFIVSPTSRGAQAADLLVTDEACRLTYSIQVKTNRSTFGFWLMSEKCMKLVSDTLFYVFVNLIDKKEKKEYFIVPSHFVAENIKVEEAGITRQQTFYALYRKRIIAFENRWDLLEKTETSQSLKPTRMNASPSI